MAICTLLPTAFLVVTFGYQSKVGQVVMKKKEQNVEKVAAKSDFS